MTVVVGSGTSWPRSVWDATMLRGLDERGQREIEAAGRLLSLQARQRLFQVGDPADSLYVVVRGECVLLGLRRGEAEPSIVRRVGHAEVLGEDALVRSFSARRLDARSETESVVAEIPLVVLKRALVRANGADSFSKVERTLRRASTRDLLRTAAFTRKLSDADVERVLDSVKHVEVARGEWVYREGDAAADAYLVADGLVQLQTSDDDKPRIEAYLARGDLFGEEELADGRHRALGVIASGAAWLIAIPSGVFLPLARRYPDLVEAARRVRTEDAALDRRLRPATSTTAHVFRDLYRMRVARSLLVIDQDSCIRCGHCAWSCASVHDDGVSRLVRQGDTIIVNDGTKRSAPLLVPNSCQHCKNPSCMIDCPTGAIGRDARGEVFIREDLCTGCGSCARACPWENIQLAPRADGATFPAVAVKCDLCSGRSGGPACVSSCPTQAIARIDPNVVLDEVRPAAGEPAMPVMPARTAAWPWVTSGVLSAFGIAALPLGRWGSGVLVGVLLVSLVGYSIGKRILLRVRGSRRPWARWLYVAHLTLGSVSAGAMFAHVGRHVSASAGGALAVAMAVAIGTGAVGALLSAVVPKALSRIERKSVLPEELSARAKQLDEQVFSALSGRTELVKKLFATALGPYRRSWVGVLSLACSRRSLREEEKALRLNVDRLTGGKSGPAIAGIDELIRLVVELRAIRLQRVLSGVLRGWLVPHVAITAVAIVLLLLHILAVSWGR